MSHLPSFESLNRRILFSNSAVATFGTGGLEGVDNKNDFNYTAVQKSGKVDILTINPSGDIVLTQLKSNGRIDDTFNGNGHVELLDHEVSRRASVNAAIAIAPDNSIVVGYSHQYSLIIARYKSNGHLDKSFATEGRFTQQEPDLVYPVGSIAINHEGDIFTGLGFELNPNGTLNTAFSLDSHAGFYPSLKVGSDDKLYASAGRDLYRLNSDGSIDTSFGKSGVILDATFDAYDLAAYAIQSDGKILLEISAYNDSTGKSEGDYLERMTSTGTLDKTFGSGGRTSIKPNIFTNFDQTSYLTLTASGDIAVVDAEVDGKGISAFQSQLPSAVSLFSAYGKLDSNFGDGGTADVVTGKTQQTFPTIEAVNGVIVYTIVTKNQSLEPNPGVTYTTYVGEISL